jgi:hypothetical protein
MKLTIFLRKKEKKNLFVEDVVAIRQMWFIIDLVFIILMIKINHRHRMWYTYSSFHFFFSLLSLSFIYWSWSHYFVYYLFCCRSLDSVISFVFPYSFISYCIFFIIITTEHIVFIQYDNVYFYSIAYKTITLTCYE